MLALQKTVAGFGLELREVPAPANLAGDEVLIEVAAVGVCGSDVHIYQWHGGYEFVAPHMPLTLGHEFAGKVLAVGPEVEEIAVGDRVTVIPGITCGRCAACLAGNADDCTNRASTGMTRSGAFAPLVAVPARQCLRLPERLDFELAALAEPLGIGLSAVETGGVAAGDRVLIMGPGTIGQAIALMARRAGAGKVVVAGKDDPDRLNSLEALGFHDTIDLGDGTLADGIAERFGQEKFDVVFEATGVPQTVQEGMALLRFRGVFVVVGIHPRPASIDLTRLVRQKLQLRGAYRATRAMWHSVLDFLHDEGPSLRPMITHRLPLDRAIEGFELASRRVASKVMLLPGGYDNPTHPGGNP